MPDIVIMALVPMRQHRVRMRGEGCNSWQYLVCIPVSYPPPIDQIERACYSWTRECALVRQIPLFDGTNEGHQLDCQHSKLQNRSAVSCPIVHMITCLIISPVPSHCTWHLNIGRIYVLDSMSSPKLNAMSKKRNIV